jgi:hypothetical protein
MKRPMSAAPRNGEHFLALEKVGIEDTPDHVLEWREIWYEPSSTFFGPTMWTAENGAARFGEDCFDGWIPLPPKD